jgi:hypothetical protein
MRSIFISYRRDDAEGQAGRLFDDLTKHFGENAVFIDVTGISAGRDFRRIIEEHVASCGVLLAIIGKNWIDAKDESGRRRLEDPTDFVRLETAAALKRDIPVVPVLVQGARMPRKDQLPEDLAELIYRNGVELTHARWESDLQLLIKALTPLVETETTAHRQTRPGLVGSRSMAVAAGLVVTVMAIGLYAAYRAFFKTAGSGEVKQDQTADPQRRAQEGVQSYPMICRGGGALSVSTAGSTGVAITFQRGRGPAASGLEPGQCTWEDRALGQGEPTTICDDRESADQYTELLGRSDRHVILQVYNDGHGCMRVTRVGAS